MIGNPPYGADVLRVCVVFVRPHKRCRALRLGVGDLGLRLCGERKRGGKNVARSRFEYIPSTSPGRRDRHTSGSGLRRLPSPYVAAESDMRRVTLRVGRVSHGSLIIHARVIINFFFAVVVHSRVFEYSRGSRPGYRPRTAAGFGPPAGRTLIGPGSRPGYRPGKAAGFGPPAGRTLIGPGRRPSVKPPATTGIVTPCG